MSMQMDVFFTIIWFILNNKMALKFKLIVRYVVKVSILYIKLVGREKFMNYTTKVGLKPFLLACFPWELCIWYFPNVLHTFEELSMGVDGIV